MGFIKSYFSLEYEKDLFRDPVSGGIVKQYVDCYGERWMKTSRWALFAVRKKRPKSLQRLTKGY